jgi:putative membrane protein insertion efficiency factor
MIRQLTTVSRETVLLPVHAWRVVSRLLPPRCKYHPSCSQYCLDAVRSRGLLIGTALSAWRVLRCNPWSLGGVDPVPPRRGANSRIPCTCTDSTRSAPAD